MRRGAPKGSGSLRRRSQLVMLSRWPAPGRCKRRLAAGLGQRRAAVLQERLCLHGLVTARSAALALVAPGAGAPAGPELVLALAGAAPRAGRRWGLGLGADRVVGQGPGSLGLRMQRQVRRALREGADRVVLIGSDLPDLAAADLIAAFEALERVPLVLGPARDGGYWLIGVRASWPLLFSGAREPIAWGSGHVLAQTVAAAERSGLVLECLAERADLDRPADLRRWR